LEVSVAREKAERIFAVVYNFGAWGEWGYDFIDEDGDGRPEIQLGPKTLDDDVVPLIHFKWDAAKKTYVGPKGEAGDHFRVINPSNIWKELDRLEEEKTEFPPVKDRANLKRDPAPPVLATPKEKTFAYVSLKGQSDEQL